MKRLSFIVIILALLTSCKDESNSSNSRQDSGKVALNEWTPVSSDDIRIITDNKLLAGYVNYGVINAFESDMATRVQSTTTRTESTPRLRSTTTLTTGIPGEAIQDGFMELATVNSPVDPSGKLLSATSIQTYGKYAIVCYHMHYKGIGGALQLLDITIPSEPKVISELYYEGLDFNHIAFDDAGDISNSKFWAAADDSKNGYAYVVAGRISQADFTAAGIQKMRVVGNAANCIVKYKNHVIVATTGVNANNGAILSFDYQTGVVDEKSTIEVQRGKHIAIDPINPNSGLLALYLKDCDNNNNTKNQTSTGLAVLDYFADNANPLQGTPTEWDIERIRPIDGKNAIRLYDGTAYLALSNQGMLVMDLATSKINKKEPSPTGLTNGIDVDGRYIYLANGSGGVRVYDKKTLEYKYTFYGNTSASANFTSANEEAGLLFVAYGIDGVKIICTKNCKTKETCDEFMKVLFGETTEYFKESQSVFRADAHPNIKTLFLDPVNAPSYLEITKDNSSLYITFLREICGWQNSLGYFIIPAGENMTEYYNTKIKPDLTSPVIPNKYILFKCIADAVQTHWMKPAGTLQKGVSYAIISDLKPGDKVFFFLVPQGYELTPDGGQVLTRNWKAVTTNPQLNEFDDQRPGVSTGWRKIMHGLFLTEACKSIVYALEDNYTNNWADSDYNDIIFSISDNRNDSQISAIDLTPFKVIDSGQVK